MAAPLGQNMLLNPSFDGPDDWVLNADPPSISEIVGGQLHCVREDAGDAANATQLGTVAVIGQEYEIRYQAQIEGGQLLFAFGGENSLFSKDGIGWARITATATTGMSIAPTTSFPSEILVDWVSIRKVNFDMSNLIMEFRDFDGDKKQFSIEMGDVTDGATYTTVSGEATALATAIGAVCAGNISRQQFVATDTEPDDTDASAFLAQAHVRWIIEYKDATTGDGPYQIAIPTPDLGDDTLVLVGSNHYDPANAEWITLIAAMEGGEVKNPRTGNNITIQDIFLEE